MTTRYTKDHEYLTDDGTVGITHYAQDQLGDIVFVELPQVGQVLNQGDEAAVVESVKAASEIYAPVSGTVTAVNEALTGDPGLVNADPSGKGWIFKLAVADDAQRDSLLDDAAYAELTR